MIRKSRRLLMRSTTVIACLFVLSCDRQAPPAAESVVATVNGAVITQEDVAVVSKSAVPGHLTEVPASDRKAVIETLIQQELLSQRATALGLDADPAYQQALRAMQAQLDTFRRKKLSELMRKHWLKQARVGDAEAKQYFNENATRLRTEIKVSQILLRDEKSIQQVQAELAQGLPFEQVAAKQFAGLPAGSRKPWELDYLQWNQLPAVWQGVIDGLQTGETSDIIRGPNHRFWIIKLVDRRSNPAIGFEELRPKIIDMLENERALELREQTMANLRDKARIVYSK